MASLVLNFDRAISYGLSLWIYQTQISQLIYMTRQMSKDCNLEQSIMYALIMYYCQMTVLLNLKRRVY
jgi:hypothetical protein